MKIAVISDIHNNEVNLEKVLKRSKDEKIETIVCCGDVASKETLDFLAGNFSGNILLSFGNAEYDDLRELACHPELVSGSPGSRVKPGMTAKYKNVIIFSDHGEANIEGSPVAFVHFPDKAKRLAKTGKYKFVFYGHTHKPWEEMVGNCKMLNPGTTGGEIYPPTFAIWNTSDDKFELIRIHNLK